MLINPILKMMTDFAKIARTKLTQVNLHPKKYFKSTGIRSFFLSLLSIVLFIFDNDYKHILVSQVHFAVISAHYNTPCNGFYNNYVTLLLCNYYDLYTYH